MLTKLRYGADSVLQLDVPSDSLIAYCDAPRGKPISDVAAELRQRLESPLDFPALALSVVPGDKVAIALDHEVPQAAVLVHEIVRVLLAQEILASDISIVRNSADAMAPDPRELLPEDVRAEVQFIMHNAADRDQLSYLAASSKAKPIYLNRQICEADVLIPIGVSRLETSLANVGPAAGLFPTFSDEQTAQRYRAPKLLELPARREKLKALANEVQWLLGVAFAIQIVPGRANEILHIVAGRSDLVYETSQQLCEQAWSFEVPYRANVVIAAIEGTGEAQSWQNVARALWAASNAVTEDGVVAVCTELSEHLGPATQRLCNADDLQQTLSEISKERPEDSLVAAELATALQRGPLYLMSQLDESVLDDLGIANVTGEEELSRLVARYKSCILISNAQHAVATLAEDTAA